MSHRPLLAITMGDPAGVGAEIAVKTLAELETYRRCRPLIVGDACVLRDAVRFCNRNFTVNSVQDPVEGHYVWGTFDVLDLGLMTPADHRYKAISAKQGEAAYQYVAKAIELAMAGRVDATVTGPINKESLNLAGHHYSGHTEIYAALTGTRDYAMMLAERDFRVIHVSTHVSLRKACDSVKTPRVRRVIELADAALKQLGIDKPRIGVCGLNPHCGEARMFGTEDEDEILPAIEQVRANGIDANGPVPADTIFSKMAGGLYDVVVAMYHDQGHIPTKLLGFKYDAATDSWSQMSGVNITLGLPIIRVSVDHGTAFDRAGEGRANHQSLVEAVRYAAQFAAQLESRPNLVGQ
jgi:4-phospho-D-threonate 3-dehydrogenase / 4-phospho-D-erythronate 3-dehydrogenase